MFYRIFLRHLSGSIFSPSVTCPSVMRIPHFGKGQTQASGPNILTEIQGFALNDSTDRAIESELWAMIFSHMR